MTSCDRLVSEGAYPDDAFEPDGELVRDYHWRVDRCVGEVSEKATISRTAAV
jgi:hypothetical protein